MLNAHSPRRGEPDVLSQAKQKVPALCGTGTFAGAVIGCLVDDFQPAFPAFAFGIHQAVVVHPGWRAGVTPALNIAFLLESLAAPAVENLDVDGVDRHKGPER